MKNSRQEAIKKIIKEQCIERQSDLAHALKQAGFEATQATVSRDIKEMMLIKVADANGKYRYAFPKEHEEFLAADRMTRTFQESIQSVHVSENIVVVRTMPGTAQAVAYAIDYLKWPEVLGTVAGDDTIFICVGDRQDIKSVLEHLSSGE